jgi:DNA-binding Lrp family transcriptional regulator
MQITREELNELYNNQRVSMVKIAKRLGVSINTVRRQMDQFDLPRRSLSEAMRMQLDENEIERLYVVERLNTNEIGNRFGTSGDNIRRRLEARGVARRSKAEASTRYPRYDFSGDPLEKAYLVGFRLGDLHIRPMGQNDASMQVSTGTTRIEQVNLFHELFSPYAHVHVGPPGKNGKRVVACQLNLSFDFLVPKVDAVPDWILGSVQNGDTQQFLVFLSGYIDAEGSFGVWADG